jgi:two-component system alkaline phosphatase synthesis response regulator PhoP
MQDGKHVVLCIDDDADILSFLEILLEAEGFIFVGAASAEAGLSLYKENTPDAVIVDLMMEEVDAGMNFARELRILRSETPIFMLSYVGDNFNLTADYSALGLAGIFQKPIARETLLSVLRATLAPGSAMAER